MKLPRIEILGPVLISAALLAIWQCTYWFIGDIALRSPGQTIRFAGELLSRPSFWPHLVETAKAFAAALAIASLLGLTIGLLLGLGKTAGDIFEPMLIALYSIPKVTLYPILLLSFGLGLSAKIAFGALHGFIPVALFTMNAARNVRPIFLKTGRVMKLSRWDVVRKIVFPAALPEIFTGLRVGFSLTMIGTVLGEMFASQRGLGYLLMNAIGLHHVDIIMAVTLMLVAFAAVISFALLAIDRHLHKRF
ncbi:MAG: ABC transporter permease subunit [Beijerinckiaceae bacterium]|nr:ABC transporter permease subunit [Beijerinckiaceae bacterium]